MSQLTRHGTSRASLHLARLTAPRAREIARLDGDRLQWFGATDTAPRRSFAWSLMLRPLA